MNERRCRHLRFSRPSRAEKSKKNICPWGAAFGFPHGQAGVLPPGAAR
ncbi:MAG: hypothetical protein AB7H80_10565 [Candidatus Kapaibacterium sp.]